MALQSYSQFWNASVPKKGGVANFAPKLVAMVTSLKQSEKEGQINDLHP